MKSPSHPWKNRSARRERLQEEALGKLASRIPDEKVLGEILADYAPAVRARVLDRIKPYLKFDLEVPVSAGNATPVIASEDLEWDPVGYYHGHPIVEEVCS